MIFKQMKYRSDNFSYIVADETIREAVIVDPSYNEDVLLMFLKDQGLRLKYIINTHSHADHTAGNEGLKKATGAKIIAYELSKTMKDVSVHEGDKLSVGRVQIKVIHTPGHSPESICLLIDGKVLTGDTLFIGECGRTDLPGGSAEEMYRSLFNKLMKLDDKTEVYPGHDYGSKSSSTIGEEKRTNYTLKSRTLQEFTDFMSQP